jgi:hypothetical protein
MEYLHLIGLAIFGGAIIAITAFLSNFLKSIGSSNKLLTESFNPIILTATLYM